MNVKKKLAILGASYLQRPLVEKANEMGLQTHVFAWRKGNVVEDIADFYYPVSVLDQESILEICRSAGIDGITSVASDIAMPSVSYVADKLGLVGNRPEATLVSTDKYEMRSALESAGLPCPAYGLYTKADFPERDREKFRFPVIVKPADRSGSRGVTKVSDPSCVESALAKALEDSIRGRAIIEEFMEGREFSVEAVSCEGKHRILAITDKVTSGPSSFVELEHHQPVDIDAGTANKISNVVRQSLDALQIEYGASHSEVFLTTGGEIRVVEIAGRMGGDWIGSHMTFYSTGFDYLKAVIEIALGEFDDDFELTGTPAFSGVYYVTPEPGRIVGIEDRSSDFESVVTAYPILQTGDRVDSRSDGVGKRAGIVLYRHEKERVHLDPRHVLNFKTVRGQDVR